ncbi:MAG: hypothetical protein LAO79_14490 [Acidobacteriia bacterium]|nr:hypothetical protein [Terriglobia bacterium]
MRNIFLILASSIAAIAQTTTNITGDITITFSQDTFENEFIYVESGSVGPLGNATLHISAIAPNDHGTILTPIQVTAGFYFNALDSITASFTLNDPNLLTNPGTFSGGKITGGTGAYAGATGSLSLAFGASATITGSGSLTAGGKTTALTLTNFHGSQGCPGCVREYTNGTVSGTITPFGAVTGTFRVDNTTASDTQDGKATITFKLNANDSFNLVIPLDANGKSSVTSIVSGGTGAFAGATGSFTTSSVTDMDTTVRAQGAGTITTAAAGAPIITQVKTAFGAPVIASNTWLQINGTNLAPTNTLSTGVDWSDAPEFASGKMPTQLGAIDSVTVDGKPGYIYFYCSAVTNPNCATDQINVLSPLFDSAQGPVQVIVTRNGISSAPFVVTKVSLSPTFPLFDTKGHVVARHLDFSLMGPASLFPGQSTPAKAGETIILVAYAMGLNGSVPQTEGSSTQTSTLPFTARCWISGLQANVAAALISPGLYQMNVTVPAQTPSGDNPIACVYPGFPFFPGGLIAVQ